MRARLAISLALVAVACRGADEAGPRIEVRRGPAIVARIPIADSDAWQWCNEGVVAVVARAPGAFVQGVCSVRGEQRFVLSRAADGAMLATLLSSDGAELARAHPVAAIELVDRVATTSPSLTVTIAGRAPVVLDAAALDELLPRNERRAGIPLRAVLARAGVTHVTAITVRGATSYDVDPAWLDAADRALTLRRNHRGELRFSDEQGGAQQVRVSGVIAIDVRER